MKQRQTRNTSTPAKILALAFGLAVAIAGITQSTQAATDTWSGAANSTWDTTSANWNAGGTFTSADNALFTGTPTNNVTVATGLTIGAITLDNTFTGSVALTGNNTVNGATTISGGTLSLATATGLGTSAVTVNSGGTLALNASTAADITYANTVAGAGKVQFLYNATGSHDIFLNNLGSFTGTIELSLASGSANTGGKARLYGATLNSAASLIIDSGTQLYMGGGNVTLANIQVSGTGNTENRGAIRAQSGILAGAISLMGDTTIGTEGGIISGNISSGVSGTQTLTLGTANSTGNITLSGNIGGGTGTIALNKTQAGTTTLSGSSTYSGGTTITGGTLSAGSNSALGTGAVTFNGGTLANTTGVTLANNMSTTSNTANLTASGGTMVLNGNITGAHGVNLTPTNKITLAGTNSFSTAGDSLAVNAGAGGVDITGSTAVGSGNSVSNTGYLNIAGTVTVTVQSGGSLNILGTTNATTPNSIVGQNAAGTSTLVVNGGSLTIGGNTGFALGNNVNTATGVLTISSGTATITAGSSTLQNQLNFVALGRDNATGTINLNGGTLATGRQFVRDGSSGGTVGAGTATFNFNGGTLQAQANQTSGNGWFETATTGNFQVVTTTVMSGGAIIDTNGFTTNINTVLAHDSTLGGTADGGLTKIGSGTLSLGASNTYTGNTTIKAGTLALGASGSFNNSPVITVGNSGSTGTVLDLTAKSSFDILSGQTAQGIGNWNIGSGKTLTVDSGAHWAPGNSIGTNSVTGNLTLAGSSDFQLGSPGTHASPGSSDRTTVSGTLTLGGTLNATDDANASGLGSAGAGAYLIFTQSGTPSGSFAVINAIGSGASVLHPVVNTATAGSTFLDVYRLAAATAPSSSVNLGNVHVGTTLTGSASVANSASNDGFSELLKATVTGSGTGFTGVAGGSNGTINYSMATSTAGLQSGSATVVLASTGAGTFGDTTLSTTNVSLSGAAYNLAAATGSQTVNVGAYHVGAGATAAVTLNNTAPVNATYTETLQTNGFSGTSANFTATGSASGIAGGGSGSGTLLVGAGAGLGSGVQSGSTTLALQSNEVNGSGLGTTNIGNQTITITGTGYNLASASAHSPEPINFGVVHQGATATQALSITNNAANDGFSEKLNASIGGATGDATTNSGSFNLLAAGSTDNSNLVAGISTSTGGNKSGTATVSLVSDGTGTSGLGTTSLASQTVNVSGQVFNGNATWTGVGNTWGTSASNNWVDSNGINAAPGTFGASFDNVDSATFDNSGTANTTVNLSGATPSLKSVTFDSTTSYTIAGGGDTLTMKSDAGNATITDTNGTHTISAAVNLASDTTVDVANSADTLTTMGGINGIKGLVKTGAGTLNSTGADTYEGTTTVSGGTLLVNGTHTGAGAYSVSNATLGGGGSITTATGSAGITLASGGKLSPGNGGVGTLTVTLDTGVFDISGTATGSSMNLEFDLVSLTSYDQVLIASGGSNALSIGSGVLGFDDFKFNTSGWNQDMSGAYTLFATNKVIDGTFLGGGTSVSGMVDGYNALISFSNMNQDIILTFTAVPEPVTCGALAGLALTGLSLTSVVRRRIKRTRA